MDPKKRKFLSFSSVGNIIRSARAEESNFRYAIVVLGLAAILATIIRLNLPVEVVGFGIGTLLVLMVLFRISSQALSKSTSDLRVPAKVFIWYTLILTIICSSGLGFLGLKRVFVSSYPNANTVTHLGINHSTRTPSNVLLPPVPEDAMEITASQLFRNGTNSLFMCKLEEAACYLSLAAGRTSTQGSAFYFLGVTDLLREKQRSGASSAELQRELEFLRQTLRNNVLQLNKTSHTSENSPSESETTPHSFNGQLRTEFGFGSGFVVKEKVVLTAAHVIFDDETMTFAKDIKWFPKDSIGHLASVAMKPTGYYVLPNYLAHRRLERQNGVPSGVSTQASQAYDLAVLYFAQPVLPGLDSAGYLVSETYPSEWLCSNGPRQVGCRTLAEQVFPFFETGCENSDFKSLYTTTALGHPGESGSPFFAAHMRRNGVTDYLPAAVYLGRSEGHSLLRVIDNEVQELIANAERAASGSQSMGVSLSKMEPLPGEHAKTKGP